MHTPRWVLRPLRVSDASWMAALLVDPDVMRHIPTHITTHDQALWEAEARISIDRRSPRLGLWAIEDRPGEQVHGWVALKTLNPPDEVEIGYRLRRQSWGRGIATESAARVLIYGFEDLGLGRIVAVTLPENAASQRVLQKLGLSFEKRYLRDGCEWCYFSLSREVWEEQLEARAGSGAL